MHSLGGTPNVTQEFLGYLRMKEISPSGVWGRPNLSRKGEKAMKIMVEATMRYIKETFKKVEKLKETLFALEKRKVT